MSSIRCPGCNRFGAAKLGGYCSICVPKSFGQEYRHITEKNLISQSPYFKDKPVPDSYGIVKKGYDVVHGKSR